MAGDAERGDPVFGDLDTGQGLGDRGAKRFLPERGSLLGPAGSGVVGLIGSCRLTEQAKFIVEDDGLETLGADIDADDGDGLISRGSDAGGQNIA